jgi:hypothetical protein
MPLNRWRLRRTHKPQHAVPEELPITLEQIHKLGLWAQAHLRQLQEQWDLDDVLLARFTATRYEIREFGAFAEVIRRVGNGGVLEWLVIVHSDPAVVVPDLVGVFDKESVALQAAADAIDRVVDQTIAIPTIEEEEGD